MTDLQSVSANASVTDSASGDILIVDDTPLNLRLLSQLLTKNGYHVRVATNGAQGLRSVEMAVPELILLDVMMPDVDGYEVCRRLKSDPHTASIPIIFISALDSADDKVRAFSMGGADYVTKPFQATEVLARVTTQLARTRGEKALREARAEAELRAREAETLRRAGAAVSATLNQDEAIERILEQLALVVPHEMAVVELANEGGLDVVGGRGLPLHGLMLRRRVPDIDGTPDYVVWRTRQALSYSDVSIQAPLYRQPHHILVRSWMGVPLLVRDQCIGVVTLINTAAGQFSPRHVEMAAAFAAQVAIALDNARVYTEIRQRADELAVLNGIGLAITAGLDARRLMQTLYDQCCQLGPIDTFFVALHDESAGLIRMPFFHAGGEWRCDYTRDLREQPGEIGYVIATRRTLYLPDTMNPPGRLPVIPVPMGYLPESRAIVCVPLVLRDRVIGVLSMQSCNPNAYTPAQIRVFESVAIQAAIAVGNSQLYEQAQQEIASRARAEQALRDANDRLTGKLAEIQRLQDILREQAIRDPLTGLFNRRYLEEVLDRELARATSEGSPLSAILFDIDHFKNVNDEYGHKAGDMMLKAISAVLLAQVRYEDVVCRYGGEEIVIAMPNAPLAAAVRRAEQWRETIAALRVACGDRELGVTLSIGVATCPRHGVTYDELLRAADEAMYAAKAAGRNCVVAAP